MDAKVTEVMPCIRAFPDLVAFASRSTELGEVKICLYVWPSLSVLMFQRKVTHLYENGTA